MAIKIEMLRTFATVANCGSLAEAAARLGRTPSAVSMTLKQLETHLGKPLFETDRKNLLSPIGAFVFEQAQNQIRQFDRTLAALENYAHAGAGSVRIAAVPSVAATILPTAFSRFRTLHPQVQISLHDMDSTRVMHAFTNDQADIAIGTFPVGFHTTNRHALLRDAFGLVCHPKHTLARNLSPLEWRGLAHHTFIANALCDTIQSEEFQRIAQQATLHVHSTLSLMSMVSSGLGVTVLPRMAAQTGLGPLVFRPLQDPTAERQIDLLIRAETAIAPATQALADCILDSTATSNF